MHLLAAVLAQVDPQCLAAASARYAPARPQSGRVHAGGSERRTINKNDSLHHFPHSLT